MNVLHDADTVLCIHPFICHDAAIPLPQHHDGGISHQSHRVHRPMSNTDRPELLCNGRCILMDKIHQAEDEQGEKQYIPIRLQQLVPP